MTASPFQRGDRIAVPYGTRTHDATVLDVRDGRVSVLIDDNADAPIETFYRVDELIPRAVVFRFCRSIPEWQFYCAPTDVIRSGRAHTLAEAQAKYRSALPFSPGSNPRPNLVKEYIERETSPGSNVWVRTPLGAPNGKDIARAIARNYESMPTGYRQFVRDTRTSRGDTVVIPVNPRDPLQTVLEQITPYDSVLLVTRARDHPGVLMWQPVDGDYADIPSSTDRPVGMSDLGITAESPISRVFEAGLTKSRSERPRRVALASA
ncbi:hypothetical protein [Mycobacteroides abscessus]|uniref:hypothetical protein n=1 Tax=Mycobacteroides abscessus TaxID=36809 RepID=UPI0005A519F2|nr:hypothetical protein [Mycobacteroides abscessus]